MIRFIKKFIALRKQRRLKQKPMGSTVLIDKKDFQSDMLSSELLTNVSDENKKKVRQYSKVLMTIVVIMASCWITFSYYLAWYALKTYQNTETLESLSKQVCLTLLGTALGYFCKSYFESWSESKHELDMAQGGFIEDTTEDINSVG